MEFHLSFCGDQATTRIVLEISKYRGSDLSKQLDRFFLGPKQNTWTHTGTHPLILRENLEPQIWHLGSTVQYTRLGCTKRPGAPRHTATRLHAVRLTKEATQCNPQIGLSLNVSDHPG